MIRMYAEAIIDNNTIEFKRNLLGLSSPIITRSNLSNAKSFGIISNTANLRVIDYDKTLLAYANANKLSENIKISIYLENTLTKIKQLVGVWFSKEWQYENYSFECSANLTDNLEKWQNIFVDAIPYDPRNADITTLKDYYVYLHSKTPTEFEMLSYDELDDNLKAHLESITIPKKLLREGNLWYQWNKLCEVAGLYIYKNANGRTVCIFSDWS